MKDHDDSNYVATLDAIDGGALLARLDDLHKQILAGLRVAGGKGELNLKLTYTLKGGRIEVDHDVKSKIPQEPIAPGLFFITDDDQLVRNDPKQLDIDFREAPKAEAPIRRLFNS